MITHTKPHSQQVSILWIFVKYKNFCLKLHWTKHGISSCRTQIGYVHDISCPLHISSQHDISHFLPYVIWRIEPNPLHITDAGRMIFPFCPQHDTWNFMLQDMCSTGAWHVGIPLTPPSLLPLYFAFTCTHILYINDIIHISTNVYNVEKWSLFLNDISCSVILFHKVDFQLLILMIHT